MKLIQFETENFFQKENDLYENFPTSFYLVSSGITQSTVPFDLPHRRDCKIGRW